MKIKQERIMSKFKENLITKYKNICPVCNEALSNGEIIEFHHIKPVKEGGKTTLRNMMPVHKICHQQITHRPPKITDITVNSNTE
jgi:RNA-directed DNA polymerase